MSKGWNQLSLGKHLPGKGQQPPEPPLASLCHFQTEVSSRQLPPGLALPKREPWKC